MGILKEKNTVLTELRQENRHLFREKEEFLALLERISKTTEGGPHRMKQIRQKTKSTDY